LAFVVVAAYEILSYFLLRCWIKVE